MIQKYRDWSFRFLNLKIHNLNEHMRTTENLI